MPTISWCCPLLIVLFRIVRQLPRAVSLSSPLCFNKQKLARLNTELTHIAERYYLDSRKIIEILRNSLNLAVTSRAPQRLHNCKKLKHTGGLYALDATFFIYRF